jgi:hypothetical protein
MVWAWEEEMGESLSASNPKVAAAAMAASVSAVVFLDMRVLHREYGYAI